MGQHQDGGEGGKAAALSLLWIQTEELMCIWEAPNFYCTCEEKVLMLISNKHKDIVNCRWTITIGRTTFILHPGCLDGR